VDAHSEANGAEAGGTQRRMPPALLERSSRVTASKSIPASWDLDAEGRGPRVSVSVAEQKVELCHKMEKALQEFATHDGDKLLTR